ncbi:hypothetical protein [Hoeflea sp.]|uniref:hypothetical protein n=1 Tax=Hoeflea sp. TaxID=1940281 RepID=UPI003A944F0B
MKRLLMLGTLIMLSSCDNKPKHYLVLCDGDDGNGWQLTDTLKKDGYLLACIYTSRDGRQSYTTRCDNDGCGIK